MSTCASVSARVESLSQRVARATQLLSTRVAVSRERQNQQVLESMNRRAEAQLRLQQTVEGLSVAAITYYMVGLVGYAAKGLLSAGVPLNVEVVIALSIPLVALAAALGVRHVRKSSRAPRPETGRPVIAASAIRGHAASPRELHATASRRSPAAPRARGGRGRAARRARRPAARSRRGVPRPAARCGRAGRPPAAAARRARAGRAASGRGPSAPSCQRAGDVRGCAPAARRARRPRHRAASRCSSIRRSTAARSRGAPGEQARHDGLAASSRASGENSSCGSPASGSSAPLRLTRARGAMRAVEAHARQDRGAGGMADDQRRRDARARASSAPTAAPCRAATGACVGGASVKPWPGQVGRDDREVPREQRRQVAPGMRGRAGAVQQQQRPARGPARCTCQRRPPAVDEAAALAVRPVAAVARPRPAPRPCRASPSASAAARTARDSARGIGVRQRQVARAHRLGEPLRRGAAGAARCRPAAR